MLHTLENELIELGKHFFDPSFLYRVFVCITKIIRSRAIGIDTKKNRSDIEQGSVLIRVIIVILKFVV